MVTVFKASIKISMALPGFGVGEAVGDVAIPAVPAELSFAVDFGVGLGVGFGVAAGAGVEVARGVALGIADGDGVGAAVAVALGFVTTAAAVDDDGEPPAIASGDADGVGVELNAIERLLGEAEALGDPVEVGNDTRPDGGVAGTDSFS